MLMFGFNVCVCIVFSVSVCYWIDVIGGDV